MHRRVLRCNTPALFLALGLLLTWLSPASVANAQIRILPSALPSVGVEGVLRRGADLEAERKWGDALSHYEDALRDAPEDAQLRERHDVAKIHYDLGRRYHDNSFRRNLLALKPSDALDSYSEILLKIDSHYVVDVDWQHLVDFGTRCVQVAVEERCFADVHLRDASPDRIRTFRQHFDALIRGQTVRSRQDARAAVAAAATLADRDLGIAPTAVILEYVCGAVDALDAYSAFLTSDQLRDVYAQIDGNFVGLGIELKADREALLIVNVIGGSPAQAAGIQAGDHILAVGRQSTRGISTDEAASLLQGPENSEVELAVLTGNEAPRKLLVRRKHVEVPCIEQVKIADPASGVGYLKLCSFQRNTLKELDAALWSLQRQGMRSLIIDLRGNPGGLLTASVDAADRFLQQGTIVSTRGRNKLEDYDYSARQPSTWRVPLVVLIDSQSASASEIFAGAIRDHHRGAIVGSRSYGKGSVQGIFPLSIAGSGVRLTTAKFYSPSGRPISNVGVTPDVVVHSTARPAADGLIPAADADEALNAALRTARGNVAQR
ncbi:MAG: S41 family peptidase [Planctomycetes bacterium]|nr:S41 family peptidase [Planctomycetota bacterium]